MDRQETLHYHGHKSREFYGLRNKLHFFEIYFSNRADRDSSAGIVTRYGYRMPVGAKFSLPVQICPKAHPVSCTMGTGFFLGRGVDYPLHLAPRLKKELSYISTPSLGLRGLLPLPYLPSVTVHFYPFSFKRQFFVVTSCLSEEW